MLKTQSISPTTAMPILQTPQVTAIPSGQVTLMAVGDIMLARTIGDLILTQGIEAPFEFTTSMLNKADIAIGNLECTISGQGEPENKTYTFRAPLEAGKALSFAGFDLLTLANNHVMDFGKDAFLDTLDNLQANQISVVGAGKDNTSARQPVIIEANGLRLAFLAYLDIPRWNYDYLAWVATPTEPGIAWGYLSDIQADVSAATRIADVVIVLLHFGIEGESEPSYQQIQSARLAIDSGAKLVIGSHTHLLQSIEKYKDGLIVYNLGNFVFDEFVESENQSAIFMARISKDGVLAHKLIPVRLQENGVPIIDR
jgi:poly-gamma-glutamate capsule biosynthesis protein CapA/YwtB (metallophosphatase superfamily)